VAAPTMPPSPLTLTGVDDFIIPYSIFLMLWASDCFTSVGLVELQATINRTRKNDKANFMIKLSNK
jgi:hypothetical protein